jgi:hypothetical protein
MTNVAITVLLYESTFAYGQLEARVKQMNMGSCYPKRLRIPS